MMALSQDSCIHMLNCKLIDVLVAKGESLALNMCDVVISSVDSSHNQLQSLEEIKDLLHKKMDYSKFKQVYKKKKNETRSTPLGES